LPRPAPNAPIDQQKYRNAAPITIAQTAILEYFFLDHRSVPVNIDIGTTAVELMTIRATAADYDADRSRLFHFLIAAGSPIS
jgi:hypothetical protein